MSTFAHSELRTTGAAGNLVSTVAGVDTQVGFVNTDSTTTGITTMEVSKTGTEPLYNVDTITAKTLGYYQISYEIPFANATAGYYSTWIECSGAVTGRFGQCIQETSTNTSSIIMTGSCVVRLLTISFPLTIKLFCRTSNNDTYNVSGVNARFRVHRVY